MSSGTVRVLVLADTDSYVKWGAALADHFPRAWDVELVLARSTAMPSSAQLADALAGTSQPGRDLPVVGLQDLRRRLETDTPDVLVLAARGWTVQAAVSVVENVPTRPVIVTGLPGVGVPVLPYGLGFRRAADVFVVHSHREVREFGHAAEQLDLPNHFALARLPYLDRPSRRGSISRGGGDREGPLVFASQALVPATHAERVHLVEQLAAVARAGPHREVVVKVRARAGETQTHHEQFPFEAIVESLPHRPPNLVVRSGPMHEYLAEASGFVTVSSTALLEAVAAGVPALALDDFGVGVSQINLALRGSGLLGSGASLRAGRFGSPRPEWCADNYFHEPADDTWLTQVHALVRRRRTEGLPAYAELSGSWRNGFREVLYRHFAFADGSSTPDDRSPVAAMAERQVALGALWLNQRRSRLLRSVLASARGAAAREFAAQNARTAPGQDEALSAKSVAPEPQDAPSRLAPSKEPVADKEPMSAQEACLRVS
ncbi:DUF6716 putative glycosyltransferase [Aeromicrobium sp. CF4.19]|uniref:DUF6716 putative glycosyltransferase n=1 Tax=Aeromicrobium sp. CF4.19 TaxID=3373082 RepID=UPI003EE5A3CB